MGRPLFLMGTIPLYLLGVAAAWRDVQAVRLPQLVSGLFLVWLVQLMTHYNNEYRDVETDLAIATPTRISGGSRVLVKKLVPRAVARIAAVVSLLLAAAVTTFLVVAVGAGWLTFVFAGAGAFLGWFYSGAPFKLESRGLGDAVIAFVTCLLLPATSYYLQTSLVSLKLLVLCAPLVMLTFALTLATALLDLPADKATGKITLAVRLGKARTMRLLVALLSAGWLTFGAAAVYLWPRWGWIALAVSTPLLVVAGVAVRASRARYTLWVERLGLATSLLLGYSTLALGMALVVG